VEIVITVWNMSMEVTSNSRVAILSNIPMIKRKDNNTNPKTAVEERAEAAAMEITSAPRMPSWTMNKIKISFKVSTNNRMRVAAPAETIIAVMVGRLEAVTERLSIEETTPLVAVINLNTKTLSNTMKRKEKRLVTRERNMAAVAEAIDIKAVRIEATRKVNPTSKETIKQLVVNREESRERNVRVETIVLLRMKALTPQMPLVAAKRVMVQS
jgi:hypothetical protein